MRGNIGSQGRQWLLSEHGSHSPRLASAETMNSARSSTGRYPEGRSSLLTDNRRRDMGDGWCINPKCHILQLVLSFCRAQLTPVIWCRRLRSKPPAAVPTDNQGEVSMLQGCVCAWRAVHWNRWKEDKCLPRRYPVLTGDWSVTSCPGAWWFKNKVSKRRWHWADTQK